MHRAVVDQAQVPEAVLAEQRVGLDGVDEAAEQVRDLAVGVPRVVVLQPARRSARAAAPGAPAASICSWIVTLARHDSPVSHCSSPSSDRRPRPPRRCRTRWPSSRASSATCARRRPRHRGRPPRRRAGTPRSRGRPSSRTAVAVVAEATAAAARAACRRGRRRGSAGRDAASGVRSSIGSDGRHAARPSRGTALLEAGREDGRLVREAFEGAREPALVAAPRRPAPGAARRRCAAAGDRAALRPPGARRCEAAWDGPDDRHDRHRVGQVAVLQPADARRAAAATPRRARCTSTRPRRWRRTRRARSHALGLGKRVRPAIYDGDTPREERAAIRRKREPDPHQPRHAPRRDPPQPPARGRTCSRTSRSSSSTRRTSTAACSARTSPTSCGGCAGIAAAYGTDAALPARQRHDRQPGRARRAADRPRRRRADRPRRLAATRARADRDVEPAADRRGARHARARALAEAAELLARPRRAAARARSAS